LKKVRTEIKDQANRINLPSSTISHAIELAREVYGGKILKRPNVVKLAAAAIYIACERENVARTFLDLKRVTTRSLHNQILFYSLFSYLQRN